MKELCFWAIFALFFLSGAMRLGHANDPEDEWCEDPPPVAPQGPINTLPCELWALTASFMPPKTQAAFAQTSRSARLGVQWPRAKTIKAFLNKHPFKIGGATFEKEGAFSLTPAECKDFSELAPKKILADMLTGMGACLIIKGNMPLLPYLQEGGLDAHNFADAAYAALAVHSGHDFWDVHAALSWEHTGWRLFRAPGGIEKFSSLFDKAMTTGIIQAMRRSFSPLSLISQAAPGAYVVVKREDLDDARTLRQLDHYFQQNPASSLIVDAQTETLSMGVEHLPPSLHHLILTNTAGNTKGIGDRFLTGSQGLWTVNLNGLAGVKFIGRAFMASCPNLQEVLVEGLTALKDIGYNCFYWCEGLLKLDFSSLGAVEQIKGGFLEGAPAALEVQDPYGLRDRCGPPEDFSHQGMP